MKLNIKTVNNYPGKEDTVTTWEGFPVRLWNAGTHMPIEDIVKFTYLDIIEAPHRVIKVQVYIG